MKKLVMFTFLALFTLPLLRAQEKQLANNASSNETSISWDKQDLNVGYIALNKPVTATYKFTNNSNKPVVVEEINTSCGCTAAKHSEAPIEPGESSEISVTYNAAKAGAFQKSVRVKISGMEQASVLNISGTVE